MLSKRRLVCALPLAAAAMLSACGFTLRGSGPQASLPFKTVYISVAESSALGTELRRNISASGATVVNDPAAAEALVEVLSEARDKVVLSLNTQGRVREYTLLAKMAFQVKDNRKQNLLGPTDIVVRRTLSFNESQVLAKEAEERVLYRDMQTDLINQMLRRVAAIKPAQ